MHDPSVSSTRLVISRQLVHVPTTLKATTPAPDGGETERYSSIIATLVCEFNFSFVNGLLT